MDIKEIKQIIDLMRRFGLTEFELEEKDFKIRLRRESEGAGGKGSTSAPFLVETPLGLGIAPGAAAVAPKASTPTPFPAASAAPAAPAAPVAPAADEPGIQVIKSPMVGTFYRSPNPEAKPFADVGTAIQADSVVCIIEAMKLMNEIHADIKGVITEVLVENGKPVEFGQPLFKVKAG